MLKLFFSDSLPERRIENIRAMRERQERKLAQLRAIEPMAQHGPEGARLTLELGLGFTQCDDRLVRRRPSVAWLRTRTRSSSC